MLALAVVAAGSFLIYELGLIGPFSPIHLLSAYTLVNLVLGVRAARGGDIARHAVTMRSLFQLALVVASLFTLTPGRTMHAVLFG